MLFALTKIPNSKKYLYLFSAINNQIKAIALIKHMAFNRSISRHRINFNRKYKKYTNIDFNRIKRNRCCAYIEL